MRDKWRQLLERFAGLSSRERVLILIAVFAVIYQLADLVIFDHQFGEIERLNKQMAQDQQQIQNLTAELNTLSTSAQKDPNRQLRDRIAETRGRVEGLNERLEKATDALISPKDMSRFLEQMLVQERELSLVRLETLESKPLLSGDDEKEAGMAKQTTPVLHRHGFVIEFRGGYLASLRYLQALEELPWRFFWDRVDYEVMEYPESLVRLHLHTLSLSEDWIGV